MTQALNVIKSLTVTDATLVGCSVPEADHPVWNILTTYALADRVILAHKIYESVQPGNVGKAPATEADWWAEVSPTNRWKLFDLSSTTQTLVDAADYYEIEAGQAVNALALVNISGLLSVRRRLTDPVFGPVYDETTDLSTIPPVASWYDWFFGFRAEVTQFVDSNIPSYPSAVLRLDFTTSGAGYIGAFIFGTQRTIGTGVRYGARLSLQDYSRKERNAWGDVVLVQRAYSKKAQYSMSVLNSELDNTYNLLAELRSTPCLWIGSDLYGSMTVFGFYASFDISISYPQHSDCSLDIEGLT